MPKLPARVIAPLLLILLLAGLVAGGYYQIQRQRSSELVIHALMTNNLANLQAALRQGGDPNATTQFGEDAPGGIGNQVKQLLLPHHAIGRQPAITCAVKTRQVGAVQILLAHGANPNARDDNGETPIMNIGDDWMDMVSLQQMSDPKYKATPYDAVVERQQASNTGAILALLLSKGGDINAETPEGGEAPTGQTALMQAAFQHTLGFVNLLLQDGADVNHTNKEKDTALFEAIDVMGPEDLAVVKALLQHGANPNAVNQQGQTPMDIAKASGKTALITLLRAHGAKG